MSVIGANRGRKPLPRDETWRLAVQRREEPPRARGFDAIPGLRLAATWSGSIEPVGVDIVGPSQGPISPRVSELAKAAIERAAPHLSDDELDQLKRVLTIVERDATFPVSSAGARPTRTLVVPQQTPDGQPLARYLGETEDIYIVDYAGSERAFDRTLIDRLHDFAPFETPFSFEDTIVDPKGAPIRSLVDDAAAEIDNALPEIVRVDRAIDFIRSRLAYDRDYELVERPPIPADFDPEIPIHAGRAEQPRPFDVFLAAGLGVCRHFSLALKLVLDRLGIDSRLERGAVAHTGLPIELGRTLKDKLDRPLVTLIANLATLTAGNGTRGYHVWNEVRLKDGTTFAADATAGTLGATVTMYGCGRLVPSFHNPWYEFVHPTDVVDSGSSRS